MSFHDQVHKSEEQASYEAARQLVLWLKTISPYGGEDSLRLEDELLKLAEDMGWPVVEDENIGKIIK